MEFSSDSSYLKKDYQALGPVREPTSNKRALSTVNHYWQRFLVLLDQNPDPAALARCCRRQNGQVKFIEGMRLLIMSFCFKFHLRILEYKSIERI